MSIQTELTRLQSAKAAIKAAIEGKGVTVPDATLLDGMAALIESIEAGGGSVKVSTGTFTTTDDITSDIVITHNLGVKPKLMCVIYSNVENFTQSRPSALAFVFLLKYGANNYGIKYQRTSSSALAYDTGTVSGSSNGTTNAWYYMNVDETKMILKQSKINSTYGIGASKEFFWIAYGE